MGVVDVVASDTHAVYVRDTERYHHNQGLRGCCLSSSFIACFVFLFFYFVCNFVGALQRTTKVTLTLIGRRRHREEMQDEEGKGRRRASA